jgi:hypothetical protein
MVVTKKDSNPVRIAALICVAVTSIFIMYMSYWLVDILSAPEWCARAINAERLSADRATSSVDLCKDLLLKQVGSLAMNSHIYAGVIALCLLVLIVIVIAGGRLNLSASKSGINTSIGKEVDPVAAAQVTADAAQAQADEIAAVEPLPEPPGARP